MVVEVVDGDIGVQYSAGEFALPNGNPGLFDETIVTGYNRGSARIHSCSVSRGKSVVKTEEADAVNG